MYVGRSRVHAYTSDGYTLTASRCNARNVVTPTLGDVFRGRRSGVFDGFKRPQCSKKRTLVCI